MNRLRLLFPLLFLLLVAVPARADWAKDYEDGMKAASAGDWSTVVSKMTAAISAKPAENSNAHTYGTIFIKYHPYYYRGIAYFNLGKLDEAIADLRRATGEGKVKIGSADSFLSRAETQLAAQKQPAAPQVAQQQPQAPPAQTRPTTPAVDPNLGPARNSARESIAAAERKMNEAQKARATTIPEFARAQELLVDARTKATQADTASDWSAVATMADRAVSTFELAVTKSQIAAAAPQTKTPTAPLTAAATEDTLAAKRTEVRRAVQAYFSGEFQESVRAFDRLASRERDNALLWAFLGASHYYNWYLGGQRDDRERAAAIDAFKSARRNSRNLRLDERYFPSRVREFYQQVQ
jgi:tetratricopeptide (TPR) repeat protein